MVSLPSRGTKEPHKKGSGLNRSLNRKAYWFFIVSCRFCRMGKQVRLGFAFDFGDAFVFDGFHQGLECIDNIRTNVSANKHEHDIVSHC